MGARVFLVEEEYDDESEDVEADEDVEVGALRVVHGVVVGHVQHPVAHGGVEHNLAGGGAGEQHHAEAAADEQAVHDGDVHDEVADVERLPVRGRGGPGEPRARAHVQHVHRGPVQVERHEEEPKREREHRIAAGAAREGAV